MWLPLLFFAATAQDIVVTKSGPVQGKITQYGRSFIGIPYAAPPARWTISVPPKPWTEVRKAIDDPPGCPQNCTLPAFACPPVQSEDCLFLDIYTPKGSENASLPVLFYIHGGNFKVGYNGGLLYRGAIMAARGNVVVVTVQYRLGSLGFLALQEGDINGNYGILDQRLALKWVQDNIAAFGGDPKRVTLSGQSAGAQSTAIHLIDPASWGLYHQALLLSNPIGLRMRTPTEARALAKDFATDVGCQFTDVACLRNAPIDKIVKAQGTAETKIEDIHVLELFEPWTPTIGLGPLNISKQVIEYLELGQYNQVPTLFGTLSQEGVGFVYAAFTTPISKAFYDALIAGTYRTAAPSVLKQYPPGSGDLRGNMSVLSTDYVFVCPNRHFARTRKPGTPPIFVYHYDYVPSIAKFVWGPESPYCWTAVCHASELPLVFHTADDLGTLQPDEVTLEDTWVGYFTNFINTGNPNTGTFTPPVQWPAYDNADKVLYIQLKQTVVSSLRKAYCDFWDKEGYIF